MPVGVASFTKSLMVLLSEARTILIKILLVIIRTTTPKVSFEVKNRTKSNSNISPACNVVSSQTDFPEAKLQTHPIPHLHLLTAVQSCHTPHHHPLQADFLSVRTGLDFETVSP